jgi:hypothetical protein
VLTDPADAQEFTPKGSPVHLECHVLGQVTLGHRDDDPGDLGGRPAEVVDQRVHRPARVGPGAVEALLVEPLGQPAVPADDPADPPQVQRLPFLQGHDLVERVRHLTGRAGASREPDLQITAADPPQRVGQLAEQGGLV